VSNQQSKKTRVNLRINNELLEWAKNHADLRNTTLTALIEHGIRLVKASEHGGGAEAPQI
jgi:predicted DNA binding CopG/RHH family protein